MDTTRFGAHLLPGKPFNDLAARMHSGLPVKQVQRLRIAAGLRYAPVDQSLVRNTQRTGKPLVWDVWARRNVVFETLRDFTEQLFAVHIRQARLRGRAAFRSEMGGDLVKHLGAQGSTNTEVTMPTKRMACGLGGIVSNLRLAGWISSPLNSSAGENSLGFVLGDR